MSSLQAVGPPPYITVPMATYMMPQENPMPPLPTYDDALKLPVGMTISAVQTTSDSEVPLAENPEESETHSPPSQEERVEDPLTVVSPQETTNVSQSVVSPTGP